MSANADIQEKIAAARRDAETLKEKIRAKRDQLADTSRECLDLTASCESQLTISSRLILTTSARNGRRN